VIQLRPARAKDQPMIKAMIREARLDPTSLKWQNFTVAESDRQIVGIAQVKPFADCREFGSFVVRSEWRSQGVGKLLIEAVLARETGDVYLMCNAPMMTYYRNYNFEPIGVGTAPGMLRLKLLVTFLLRLFGVRIVCMQRRAHTTLPSSAPSPAL
jgi:amino-acid N-acetyltransferase